MRLSRFHSLYDIQSTRKLLCLTRHDGKVSLTRSLYLTATIRSLRFGFLFYADRDRIMEQVAFDYLTRNTNELATIN